MEKNKKLTISLSVLDLAKMDILVDNLYYSSRSEFIREAVRKQLSSNEDDIQGLYDREIDVYQNERKINMGGIGVVYLRYEKLIKAIESNMLIDIVVIGALWIDSEITLDLIERGLDNIKVYGNIKASKEIRDYITNKKSGHKE